MRKSILLIAFLFLVGSVLVACGESDVSQVDGEEADNNDNNEDNEEVVEDNNEEANEDESEQNEGNNEDNNDGNNNGTEESGDIEETISVGDTMNFDGLEITLNEAFTSSGNEFEEPENDHFVLLDMTIENTTEEEAHVSTLMQMSLQDDESYTHDVAIFTDAEGSLDGELGPGRDMRGQVAFDVNESETYEFIFEHPFTSGQAIWEIPADEVE